MTDEAHQAVNPVAAVATGAGPWHLRSGPALRRRWMASPPHGFDERRRGKGPTWRAIGGRSKPGQSQGVASSFIGWPSLAVGWTESPDRSTLERQPVARRKALLQAGKLAKRPEAFPAEVSRAGLPSDSGRQAPRGGHRSRHGVGVAAPTPPVPLPRGRRRVWRNSSSLTSPSRAITSSASIRSSRLRRSSGISGSA